MAENRPQSPEPVRRTRPAPRTPAAAPARPAPTVRASPDHHGDGLATALMLAIVALLALLTLALLISIP